MKYCLIGEKLGHSYSKVIHNLQGLDYSLVEVERGKLEEFVKEGYDGFNVTIPYKKDIIPLLDEVEEEITRLIEDENEVIESEYAEFYKRVWEDIGSFNELLGCAKCGHKGMHLTKDVDEYNANVIACEVRYNEHLVVEFTYGDYKRGFYPSGAWYKGVEVGFDLTDVMK